MGDVKSKRIISIRKVEESKTSESFKKCAKALAKVLEDGTPNNGYLFYRVGIFQWSDPDVVAINLLGSDAGGNFKNLMMFYNTSLDDISYAKGFVPFIIKYEGQIKSLIRKLLIIMGEFEESGLAVGKLYFDLLASSSLFGQTDERYTKMFAVKEHSTGEYIFIASKGDEAADTNCICVSDSIVSKGTLLQCKYGVFLKMLSYINQNYEKCVPLIQQYKSWRLPMSEVYEMVSDEDKEVLKPYINLKYEDIVNNNNIPDSVKTRYIALSKPHVGYLIKILPEDVAKYVKCREYCVNNGYVPNDGLGIHIFE